MKIGNKGTVSEYSIAEDIAGLKILFVNIYMIGIPGKGNPWVLVDAGLQGSYRKILKEAENLFGVNNPPRAIILTHGHFDHVGALPDLLQFWSDVKVYAHSYELPYLTGRSSYPPPDPLAANGAMAYMSWVFPFKPINIGNRVHALPMDGSIPELPDWKYIFTPGHSPGHISLYRERDKKLIVGDAFTTTNQNSLTSVLLQRLELHGPPAYFTIDWKEAYHSVLALAALKPQAAGTGHGVAVFGEDLQRRLQHLLGTFEKKEIPAHGRYVKQPVLTDDHGVREMPSPVSYKVAQWLGLAIGVVALGSIGYLIGHSLSKNYYS